MCKISMLRQNPEKHNTISTGLIQYPLVWVFYFCVMCMGMIIFSGCAAVPHTKTPAATKELAETYYNLGNAYLELNRERDATRAFGRALEIDPDFYSAGYNLSRVYILTGNYKNAKEILLDLLDKDLLNLTVRETLAWAYYKAGQGENAVKEYKNVLDHNPVHKNALYNLSLVYFEWEEYSEAYPLLKKLYHLEEKDVTLYLHLGKIERELDLSSGRIWFTKAWALDKTDETIFMHLTQALEDDGRFAELIDLHTELENQDLHTKNTLFDKAFILLTAIEDYREGLAELTRALEKGFHDLERIKKLLEYPDLLDTQSIEQVVFEYIDPSEYQAETSETITE